MIIPPDPCQGHKACPHGDRNTHRGYREERCGITLCRVRTQPTSSSLPHLQWVASDCCLGHLVCKIEMNQGDGLNQAK